MLCVPPPAVSWWPRSAGGPLSVWPERTGPPAAPCHYLWTLKLCFFFNEVPMFAAMCKVDHLMFLHFLLWSDGCQICHSSVHKTHALYNDMGVRWVSDGCQMGVRFATAQSARHMHNTMTCLNGDCVVLVTITITYTRDVCQMGVRLSQLSPQDTCTI